MEKSIPKRTGVGMSFLDLHHHPVFGSQKVHASSDQTGAKKTGKREGKEKERERERAVWFTKRVSWLNTPAGPRPYRFESASRMSNKRNVGKRGLVWSTSRSMP
jgi:hypothetical protein